jgi:peptidoglycan/xylan/chitin deacetylase (PgdA/CDA1 family)
MKGVSNLTVTMGSRVKLPDICMMYSSKTPWLVQRLLPGVVWRIATELPVIYLTFDDGPIPEVTPWVLDLLDKYSARATFFCVGANVQRHPELFADVLQAGHRVGNHTKNHLNAWSVSGERYLSDVESCHHLVGSAIFRPPYGRLTPCLFNTLRRRYRVVMWDVLSGDFDPSLSADRCFRYVLAGTRPGSIVVFHDSIKALPRLRRVLPLVLSHYAGLGYRFEALPDLIS